MSFSQVYLGPYLEYDLTLLAEVSVLLEGLSQFAHAMPLILACCLVCECMKPRRVDCHEGGCIDGTTDKEEHHIGKQEEYSAHLFML